MKNKIKLVFIYIELILVAVLVLLPVLWIVGSSLGRGSSLANAEMFPDSPTLQNYANLFKETDFGLWYMNTLKVAIVNMVCSTVVSTMTAYVFSRFNFKWKKQGLMSMMVIQMFPSFMSMTAIYILFHNFGMLDNLYALALTYIAGQIPYNTWLMKGTLDGLPRSLDEAAMIDGASRLQVFIRIIIPLSLPMITFLAVTTFMSPWMDYVLPRLLITSGEKKTLAVGLYELISGATNNNYTLFASGAILVAVPITILYMCLQRYLIQGITAGATKE